MFSFLFSPSLFQIRDNQTPITPNKIEEILERLSKYDKIFETSIFEPKNDANKIPIARQNTIILIIKKQNRLLILFSKL